MFQQKKCDFLIKSLGPWSAVRCHCHIVELGWFNYVQVQQTRLQMGSHFHD